MIYFQCFERGFLLLDDHEYWSIVPYSCHIGDDWSSEARGKGQNAHLLKSKTTVVLFLSFSLSGHRSRGKLLTHNRHPFCRLGLHLCWEVSPTLNENSGYDTTESNGKASVLELWGKCTTPSLSLLPGPLWLRVLVPVRVPSMDK